MKSTELGEIYKITCPDGKIYIGQCVSYLSNGKKYGTHGRWLNHLADSRRQNGGNCRRLNEAIRMFGENAFIVETLLTTHISLLDFYEEITISLLNCTNIVHGYNIRQGGNHSRLSHQTKQTMSFNRQVKPCFKQQHEQLTKEKISKTLINNVVRYNIDNKILPKYMKYINWKDRQGYAIVSHPECKLKYFVSRKQTLEDQYNRCIEFLESLHL
jgi:hypothetical protein